MLIFTKKVNSQVAKLVEGCLTVLGEGGMIGMICEEIHKRS